MHGLSGTDTQRDYWYKMIKKTVIQGHYTPESMLHKSEKQPENHYRSKMYVLLEYMIDLLDFNSF